MEYNAPDGFTLEVHADTIKVKGKGREQTVKFTPRLVTVKQKGSGIDLQPARKETRKLRAAMLSIVKHLKNASQGIETPYEAHLEVVYAHFPISVEVKGTEIHVKNFLGEKMPRKAMVSGKAKVDVKGQSITVTGNSKDDVGQTAANIVQATRIVKRDVRVFQDGIYKVD